MGERLTVGQRGGWEVKSGALLPTAHLWTLAGPRKITVEDWGEVGEPGRVARQSPPSRLMVMRPEPRSREEGRDVRILRLDQF